VDLEVVTALGVVGTFSAGSVAVNVYLRPASREDAREWAAGDGGWSISLSLPGSNIWLHCWPCFWIRSSGTRASIIQREREREREREMVETEAETESRWREEKSTLGNGGK